MFDNGKYISILPIGVKVFERNGDISFGDIDRTNHGFTDSSSRKFTLSSDKYDAGQSVEPAFDKQDFTLNNPIPLLGVKIHYYETDGRANNKFIALQLKGVDMYDTF